jgi:transcriptional regulator with GAF, ATPase, and Fis domain
VFRDDLFSRITVFHIDVPPCGTAVTIAWPALFRYFIRYAKCARFGRPVAELTSDAQKLPH